MARVLLYHYPEGQNEPTEYEIWNATAKYRGLCSLLSKDVAPHLADYEKVFEQSALKELRALIKQFGLEVGVEQAFFKMDYTILKPAYNKFQASCAERWKKIAIGFLSDYNLVLDEDRTETVDALRRAFEKVNNGTNPTTIRDIGDKILQLGRGPIVVTTTYTSRDEFPSEERVTIVDFKKALQRYQENPVLEEIELLLQDNTTSTIIPLERVLEMIERAVKVPRYWP